MAIPSTIWTADPEQGATPPAQADMPSGIRGGAGQLIGRENEAAELLGAVARAVAGESVRVVLVGAAGAGKTQLLSVIRDEIQGSGGVFGVGREEPIASPRLLGGLGAAIDSVAHQLLERDPAAVARVRQTVAEAVGTRAGLLAPMGGWLPWILPEISPLQPRPATTDAARLNDAVERLVGALARDSAPFALCCDDAQRADPQTLQMLTTLARTSPSTGLLIVEVWRDGPEYAQRASSFGEATAVIRVCDLPAAAADAFLAQVCGDFGADHLPFSALLWQRTAGNPFHLHTCIDHLIAERAILPPAEDCAFWRVDLGRATSLDATADAAALAALRLNGLSPPCKHALAMAARLGSSFSEPPLARALGVSPQETAVCLAQAMAAGVVAPPPGGQSAEQGGVWRFVHDRLHEAALGLVDEAAGRAMHALVGRQMWAALCADSPAVDIMQAMYQRNLGAAEVDSATESAELQAGHLRAARAARSVGAFAAALSFADAGLAGHSANDIAQTQGLLLEAARAACATAPQRVPALVQAIVASHPAQAMLSEALSIRADASLMKYDTQAAMADIRAALAIHGYALPERVTPVRAAAALVRARWALRGAATERLWNLPDVSDPQSAAILHLLLRGSTAAYLLDAQLFGYLCCEMVRIGLAAGNCPATAFGALMFGLIEASALGRPDHGVALGRTALEMTDRYPNHGIHALSRAVWWATLAHIHAPLRSTLAPLRAAFRLGLAEGDSVQAGVCAYFYLDHLLFCGTPLVEVGNDYELFLGEMRARDQIIAYQTAAPFAALVRHLRGEPDSFGLLEDRALSGSTVSKPFGPFVVFCVHLCRCILAVLKGSDAEALTHVDAAQPHISAVAGTIHVPLLSYFEGIAAGRLHALGAKGHSRRLHSALRRLRRWSSRNPHDYSGRVALLSALSAWGEGAAAAALAEFEKAAAQLGEAGLIHELAIVHATLATLHAACAAPAAARLHRVAAWRAFADWGSPPLVAMTEVLLEAAGPATRAQSFDGGQVAVDLVMRGTETLSGGQSPKKLLEAFCRLTLTHLGAQRVVLVEHKRGELRVRAILAAGQSFRLVDAPLSAFSEVCATALWQVARTGETVGENDVGKSPTLGNDAWVVSAGLKSLVVLPVLLHGALVQLVVAEHAGRAGAFAASAIAPLRVIAAAGAALLENSELVEEKADQAQALLRANLALEEQRQSLEIAVVDRTAALDDALQAKAAVLGALWEGVCGLDAAGRITFANAAALRLLGDTGAVGKPFHATFHDPTPGSGADVSAPCPLCDAQEPLHDLAVQLRSPAGVQVWVECSLQPQREGRNGLARVMSFRDVSQRRQLEAQLRHSQKTEAIGRFVGGVAHEFNNLLTPIIGHIELARAELPADHGLQAGLADVADAGQRAADLVRQLLTLGRRTELDRRPVDMVQIVEQVMRLLRPTMDRRITLEQVTPDGPVWSEVHADQIHQVLLNLCLNARDAVLSQDRSDRPPRIEVSLRVVSSDQIAASGERIRCGGDWLELAVTDNGVGISAEVQSRIFEPFFTTKKEGLGAGLGLGVAQGIVELHDGWMSVTSEPGVGTTVRCMFPPCAGEASAASPSEVVVRVAGGMGKNVLIIDDEPVVRRIARAVLARSGFHVTEAASGSEGLEAIRRGSVPDVVLLDVQMPGLDGWQTLEALRQLEPNVPVIMWSGFDGTQDHQNPRAKPDGRIRKPVVFQELVDAVQGVLCKTPPA